MKQLIVVSDILESLIEENQRFLKLLKFGENDNINAFQASNFGEDSNIPAEYSAIYLKTSNSEEPICIGVVNKVVLEDLNPGEKQIFSTSEDGAEIASFIKLLNDGTHEFNGNADFIAGFNDLKAGFDQLVSDVNDAIGVINDIVQAFANWTPSPQDGGAALKAQVAALQQAQESSAAIDDCKKENLKTE